MADRSLSHHIQIRVHDEVDSKPRILVVNHVLQLLGSSNSIATSIGVLSFENKYNAFVALDLLLQ